MNNKEAVCPGGGRSFSGGSWYSLGYQANWWAATVNGSDALSRLVDPAQAHSHRYAYVKTYGFSVRCVGNLTGNTFYFL